MICHILWRIKIYSSWNFSKSIGHVTPKGKFGIGNKTISFVKILLVKLDLVVRSGDNFEFVEAK